jgi:hypothetical protein
VPCRSIPFLSWKHARYGLIKAGMANFASVLEIQFSDAVKDSGESFITCEVLVLFAHYLLRSSCVSKFCISVCIDAHWQCEFS